MIVPTGVTITAALLALCLTPVLSRHAVITWIFLTCGLLAAIYAIVKMFGLFQQATK
jgi:hypothetical protein